MDTLTQLFAENATWHTPGNGLHHNSGERNGKTLSTDCCIVFDIVGGRVVSRREYFYDLPPAKVGHDRRGRSSTAVQLGGSVTNPPLVIVGPVMALG